MRDQRPVDVSESNIHSRSVSPDTVKPENVVQPVSAKPQDVSKSDGILSEQTISNKEQRKVDWAIIKEMARYLWPKVCSLHGRSRIMLIVRRTT